MKLSRFNEEQIISVPCGLKLALPAYSDEAGH